MTPSSSTPALKPATDGGTRKCETRDLEADPELENRLESQRELVTGGAVLGQTITVPEDTRALLRQLLTSTDRQGVLAQIQANLGSVAPLVAAVLALIGFGAAAGVVGRGLIHQVTERTGQPQQVRERTGQPQQRTGQPQQGRRSIMVLGLGRRGPDSQKATPAGVDWRAALGDNRKVTVWLRSGTKVAGTVNKWYPPDVEQGRDHADVSTKTILRLDEATLTREGAESGAQSGGQPKTIEFVLVSVEDIELIAKTSVGSVQPVA
jgi:hypothetical protein